MRKLLSLILVALMVFALVGCAGAPEEKAPAADKPAASESKPAEEAKPADGEKRVLRVAGESWQVSKIFLEEAAKIYEEAHPDVDVEIITYADTSVLSTYSLDWAQGKTDVDLVFTDGIGFAKQFAAKDLIYDYEKDLDFFADYDVNKMKPGVVEFGKIDGNMIYMPIIYEVYGVSVNVEMFKEAGLVDAEGNPLPINTWEDFYEFAKKLTIDKDGDGVIDQQGASIQFGNNTVGIFSGTLAAQYGQVFAEDGVSFNFGAEGFADIIANWQKGIQDGYYSQVTFNDNSGGRNALKAGTLAMCYEAAGRWMEADQMLGEGSCTVLPIPGGQGTYGFAGGVVIPKCSENADLACSFIKEALWGEYVQTNTFTQFGKMSVIAEYYDAAVASKPQWDNISDSLMNALTTAPYEEQQKFLNGCCEIMQAGLVDPDMPAQQIVDDLIELSDSVDK